MITKRRVHFLLHFSLPWLLMACSSGAKYGLEVSGRYEQYTETFPTDLGSALSALTGQTVTVVSGDPQKAKTNGTGFQIGLVERQGPLVTRLSLYQTQYEDIDYAYNLSGLGSITQKLKYTGVGLDGALGYQLWFLRPQISYKIEKAKLKVSTSGGGLNSDAETEETLIYLGGGLAGEIPLSQRLSLLLEGHYRVVVSGRSDGAKTNSLSVQAGLVLGF